MPADFVFKQGDTAVVAQDTLTLSNGTPVDLTNATVTFVMRSLLADAPVALTGTTSIVEAVAGAVEYAPSVQDTAAAGLYMANWVVTLADTTIMTFPTVGYLTVRIEENLVTAGGAQLVSLPDVKDYLMLQANDRVDDAKLIRFIHAVRPMIENITGPIIPATFDELYDGGTSCIQLRRRPSTAPGTSPIITLTSCTEYIGSTAHPLAVVTDPSQGTTYSVQVDTLCRLTRRTAGGGVGIFARGENSVHVVYTVGQARVPENVYEAALEAIRVNYQTTQAVGRGRLAQTDDADTGAPLGFFMPRRVREMLSPNRRHPSVA